MTRSGSKVDAREYPGTWAEFLAWFPDEAACVCYLERLRWPEGIACAACGERRGWRTGDGRFWICAGCARKTSVTAGAGFDTTRTPPAPPLAGGPRVAAHKHRPSGLRQPQCPR